MSAVLSHSVLVLNRDFVADRIASVRDAINLLLKGVAEVVEIADTQNTKLSTYNFASWQDLSEFRNEFERDKHKWIHSVNVAVQAPVIIRLLRHARYYKRLGVKLNRHNLFARDNYQCQYCGKKFRTQDLTLEHVIPKSRGGKMTWANIVCACVKCNSRKANRTPHEAGMVLIKKPESPKHTFPIPKMAHSSWAHFVDMAYWHTTLQD